MPKARSIMLRFGWMLTQCVSTDPLESDGASDQKRQVAFTLIILSAGSETANGNFRFDCFTRHTHNGFAV